MRVPTKAPKKTPKAQPKTVSNNKAQASLNIDASSLSLITLLERIATDEDNVSARDRTAAARAVMEARGELGKHQRAPGDALSQRPLSDLSRPELEAELRRLRLHFAARAPEKAETFEDLLG
jgi:hypothetical protein